jgi:2'-5' RNA ligase
VAGGGRGGPRRRDQAETGLLLALPGLAAFTARWRATSYAPGHPQLTIERRFPPHLTLLTPWLDPNDPAARVRARAVAARHRPLTLRFTQVRSFDGGRVVWLVPEPAADVQHLVLDVIAAFPECPPYYGGECRDPVPHVTVSADAGPHVLAEVRGALAEHGPLEVTTDRVSGYARDLDLVWREVISLPLGG